MRNAKAWIAVLVLILGAGVAASPAAAQGLKHPKDAVALFEQATASGDADAIAAAYAPKATLFMPDGNTVVGREAIRAVFARSHAAGPNTLKFTNVTLDGDDKRAVMIWAWVREIAPPGKAPVKIVGRSMLYWVHGKNGWQIAADMYQHRPVQ